MLSHVWFDLILKSLLYRKQFGLSCNSFHKRQSKVSDFPQITSLPMRRGQCPVSPASFHCFSHCTCLSCFPSSLGFSPFPTLILLNNEHQFEKLHLQPLPHLILPSLLHPTLQQVVCFQHPIQDYASLRSLFLLTTINLVTLRFSDYSGQCSINA